jgi:hypothetical protein
LVRLSSNLKRSPKLPLNLKPVHLLAARAIAKRDTTDIGTNLVAIVALGRPLDPSEISCRTMHPTIRPTLL